MFSHPLLARLSLPLTVSCRFLVPLSPSLAFSCCLIGSLSLSA